MLRVLSKNHCVQLVNVNRNKAYTEILVPKMWLYKMCVDVRDVEIVLMRARGTELCPLGAMWNRFTANLRTKILDFKGFDTNIILNPRGGILISIGMERNS